MRGTKPEIVMVGWLATVLASVAATAAPWHWSLDVDLVRQGEWWRLATGHFVHLTASHLILDLLALGVALATCWRLEEKPGEVLCAGLAVGGVVSIQLLIGQPVAVYGGLSGVIAGLVAWAAARLLCQGEPAGGLLLLGIAIKIWLEAKGVSASGVHPVWQAHGAGVITGALAGVGSSVRLWWHRPVAGREG